MVIGLNKEKLIDSKKILSYFKVENNRELYRRFVESAMKCKLESDGVLASSGKLALTMGSVPAEGNGSGELGQNGTFDANGQGKKLGLREAG